MNLTNESNPWIVQNARPVQHASPVDVAFPLAPQLQGAATFATRKPLNMSTFMDNLFLAYGTIDGIFAGLTAATEKHPIEARLDLQVFLNALGREEESFAVSQKLLEIAPEDSRVLFNHGWHWLKRGQLQKGLALLEFGRPLKTYGNPHIGSSRPLWSPETGRDQHVLLVLEGGYGDQIIGFRFGKDLVEKYGCKVTVICQPDLAPLFAKQAWVSAVAQPEAALGIYHDSWLPGMSAPLALGFEYKDLNNQTYIVPGAAKVEQWSRTVSHSSEGRLRVGIRWAGNPKFEHQQLRLFPPELLVNLREHSGVRLYSFQRDHELIALPHDVVDFSNQLATWDDTAAALSVMDLVITSCTSIAHMSAALGKPTWVLVPALPYFTWATPGNTSPWYKSVLLFRQASYGSWENVKTKLNADFSKWISEHKNV